MTFNRSLVGLFALIILSYSISCNEDTFSFADQFEADQLAIKTFLDNNEISTLQDTTIGLHYRILEGGNGIVPKINERMNFTYSISELGNDKVAVGDTSKTHLFTNILKGMSILMGYVEENGVIEMYLPSGYAYGALSTTNLGANSPVVVTVRLNKIIKNDTEQFAYDQYLVDEHIVANNLEATIDTTTELRYVIVDQGEDFKPQTNSDMIVTYEGRIMDGALFDSGEKVRFNLNSLIPGWKALMPKVAEGGKIIMFIPSKYGYGGVAKPGIAPYSILKFEVELIELPT